MANLLFWEIHPFRYLNHQLFAQVPLSLGRSFAAGATQVHISVAQNCMLVAEIHMFVIQICMFPYFLLKSLDPYFSALKSRYFCFSAPRFLCTRVPETLLGTLWWPVSFRTPQAPIPAQRSNEFWQKSWESQFQMATEMTSHGSIRMDIYMLEITYLIHLDR